MNLQTEVDPRLWVSVSRPYELGLYKNAILNAFHYLTDILREKADLSSDGTQLVNQALAGQIPKLRINRLQTPSEKDEQEGLKLMLLGLYQGIRNPRSHELIEDSKEVAEAVILFVNYLVRLVNKATPSFTIETWIKLVFDKHFAPTNEYVDTLIAEIPPQKRLETLIRLFEMRHLGERNEQNLLLIFRTLNSLLDNNQQSEFLTVVSKELRSETTDSEVSSALKLLPAHLWPLVDKVARLRTEHRLIRSIESGIYVEVLDDCNNDGILGICAADLILYFDPSTLERLLSVMFAKLEGEENEIAYVMKFFFMVLPATIPKGKFHAHREIRYITLICDAVYKFSRLSIIKKRLTSTEFGGFAWRGRIIKTIERENPYLYQELFEDEDIPF